MPNDLIKKIAEQQGVSIHSVEKYWDDAKKEANKENPSNYWKYVTSIVERETGYKSKRNKK